MHQTIDSGTILQFGVCVGPYRIVEVIGSGGMGVVYRAHDTRLDRDVALKIMSTALDSQPEAAARFEQEARAVAALSHSNIVAIYDVGRLNGRPYSVTELLEGESLRARIARGPLGWREAAEMALAAAHGLGAAHARGIVHRDVKPENLFVTKEQRIKVLDFGLARTAAAGAMKPAAQTGAFSDRGLIIGTIGYLAPEQARGEPAGPASDVFALGCVLYEMAAGMRPFDGATAIERLAAVLSATPAPLTRVAPGVPPGLADIVSRCLEKAPERRFADASALAEAIHAVLANPAIGPAVMRPRDVLKLHIDVVDPATDAPLWGQQYTGAVDDVLALLETLAGDISDAVQRAMREQVAQGCADRIGDQSGARGPVFPSKPVTC